MAHFTNFKACIIDNNAEGINVELHIVDNVPENDESHAESLRGMRSFMHCLATELTSDQVKVLHSVLNKQYSLWAAIYYPITICLTLISFSEAAVKAVTSIPGALIINGMIVACIVTLAANMRLKELKYIGEWYAFSSQILFAYGSTTSPGIVNCAKCAAQMAILSLFLVGDSVKDKSRTASGSTIIVCVFVSITHTFILHAFAPYETGLGLYMAIMYSLGWSVYMLHESFKQVLVRKV